MKAPRAECRQWTKVVGPRPGVAHSARHQVGRSGDDGFTLIEAVLAIGLLAMVVSFVVIGAINALAASALVKERTIATALISTTVAEAEALPFSSLQAGLDPSVDSALATDPNVTVAGSTYTLKLTGGTIATSGTTSPEAPLVPHITTLTDGIVFHLAAYPTVSSSSPAIVTLVVIVTGRGATGATVRVVGETQIASQ